MRIRQITENQENTNTEQESGQEFDLMEDLLTFMRNDPIFYRKNYFPMIVKMCDCAKKQKKFDKNRSILPIIKSGYKQYCEKYGIRQKNAQYNKQNVISLLNNIYTEEMKNINNGEYD